MGATSAGDECAQKTIGRLFYAREAKHHSNRAVGILRCTNGQEVQYCHLVHHQTVLERLISSSMPSRTVLGNHLMRFLLSKRGLCSPVHSRQKSPIKSSSSRIPQNRPITFYVAFLPAGTILTNTLPLDTRFTRVRSPVHSQHGSSHPHKCFSPAH